MTSTSTLTFPLTVPALRVSQPMGVFYVTVLPARLLMEVCFSDQLRISGQSDSTYELEGNQRELDEQRLHAIARYVSRADYSFPNTIILAAQSLPEEFLLEEKEEDEDVDVDVDVEKIKPEDPEEPGERWIVSTGTSGTSHTITIPNNSKAVAIIDGQHRLRSFEYAIPERLDMPLVCSVFFDLNNSLQAQLFATINSNQKPVSKSLTYELFGYNIFEEPEDSWSPDKLAVFLTRKLNTEEGSPLRKRIAIAPDGDLVFADTAYDDSWHVSMATIVDGIIRLISTNAKEDSNELLKTMPALKRSVLNTARPKDRAPLRRLYVEENDTVIYSIVRNFLSACEVTFWQKAQPDSFIFKTVGLQALFDILRMLAPEIMVSKKATVPSFVERLAPAADINFSRDVFRSPSGTGRGAIKNAIKAALRLT